MTDAEPSGPTCAGCDYLLTGLPAGTCPECGKPFDSGKPETVKVVVREVIHWPGYVAFFCLLLTGLLAPVFGRNGPAWRRPPMIEEFLIMSLPLAVCGLGIGLGLCGLFRGRWYERVFSGISAFGCIYAAVGFLAGLR
jgi:hypothetical protein